MNFSLILFFSSPGKMKNFLSLSFILLFTWSNNIAGQGVRIGSQTSQPHQSAGLEVDFTDKGFLLPRITTAQRNAISSPAAGLQIYNTDNECLEIYHTPNWQAISCKCTSLPNPSFTFSSPTVNTPVSFQASQSNLIYQWSFPGGTPTVATTQSTQVTYAATGTYSVSLIVSDANGCMDSSTQSITVNNPSVTYNQQFSGNVSFSSSQCTAWTQFRASLQPGVYSTMTFTGSLSGASQTCTNPTAVNQIATALQNGTATTISCGGNNWIIALNCGPLSPATVELTSTGSTCNCNTGFTLRPCIDNNNWGSAGGSTCGGPNQTLILTFQ
jgi:PKD repeat protein